MTFPPQIDTSKLEVAGAEKLQADPAALSDSGGKFQVIRRVLSVLLILIILVLIVLVAVPVLRTRVLVPLVNQATERLPLLPGRATREASSGRTPGGESEGEAQGAIAGAPAEPIVTPTPSATPHPAAALDFDVDHTPGKMRWQIAYPGSERGPELGCAYLSFWFSGPDAAALDAFQGIDAELIIYDGEFIFERYGPAPLESLRSLSDPRYYEIPAGEPDCGRHRFGEVDAYAGMEFRLALLAEETPIRLFRGVLDAQDLAFATITPTPSPGPPTPTPYPQVRAKQEMNVRSGPGTGYAILGSAQTGAVYPVTGIGPQQQWWQIDYLDQTGWVYAELVEALGVDAVPTARDIPPTPPPTATSTPVPPTPAPTLAPTPYFPFLLDNEGVCAPNQAMTYFEGRVIDQQDDPLNGACVHVAYEGPRNTKCTGCDGATEGKWGFAPFGNLPGKQGTTVRIYVVPCPEDGVPTGGQNPGTGFGPLNAVSPVWTYTIGASVQCTGIVFKDNRFFDEGGNQIPPPTPTSPPSDKELYRFTGQGQNVTPVFQLQAEPVVFNLTHAGDGNFIVQLLSSTGRRIDTLADATGPFDGSKQVEIDSQGAYLVTVTAGGAWTIAVEKP